MAGRVSDFQVDVWLRQLQSGTFLALHYDNPDVAGAYASEVFGSGYTRQPITFTGPDARAMWNLNAVTFTALPPVTVTHLALWDVQANGNLLASFDLDAPIRVLTGKSLSFPAQQIAFSID